MKKKVISILVIMLFFASIFGTVNADKICGCKDSDESNTNINTQSTTGAPPTIDLGRGEIMGNGIESESYATATCYNVDDIECSEGHTIEVWIDYHIRCHGLWDWGQVTAKVNGVEKSEETNGNIDGYWTWDIKCSGGGGVNWEITCKMTDGWTKKDYCSGSLKFPCESDLYMDPKYYDYVGDNAGNAGESVYIEYVIENRGDPGSTLHWAITTKSGDFFNTYSDWRISPQSGSLEKGETQKIRLDWILPSNWRRGDKISGTFRIQNKDNDDDDPINAPVHFTHSSGEDLEIYDEDDTTDGRLKGGKHYVKVHWRAKDESASNPNRAVKFFWKHRSFGPKHYEAGKKDFYENGHLFEAYVLYEGQGSTVILGAETPDGREVTKEFTFRVSVHYPKSIEKDFTIIKILYEKFPLIAQLLQNSLFSFNFYDIK